MQNKYKKLLVSPVCLDISTYTDYTQLKKKRAIYVNVVVIADNRLFQICTYTLHYDT